ncbi:hypothetical protein [Halorubrum sp. SD683]|uniref:hypothetical protein n=1 Tax=Halorubrum sp. SD683 TaxID=1855873 RepID=UPI000A2D31D6|nr:hypothetical protein [Halorubrum sp. SD683]OTF01974.1 hypothetical protein B9G49_01640 [Halorubrum sp. SD683]
MAPDDSAADSGADADDVAESPDREMVDRPTAHSPERLAARLSDTVPSRRAYGMERVAAPEGGGLLTSRERQYLRQAERLDQSDRDAVEEVVAERVDEFVDTDWPVIRENCPEVADALREELCGSD